MWKHYRRTFVPMQMIILTICLIAYFHVKVPLMTVFFYFLSMELFAVVGAAWGQRLKSKFRHAKDKDDLPPLLG